MSDETVLTHPDNAHPNAFTQAQLEWLPWLEPLPEAELTERHFEGLVDASRAKSPYFRLLARDPDILGARTRTDKDIFYNPEAGLPRAEPNKYFNEGQLDARAATLRTAYKLARQLVLEVAK